MAVTSPQGARQRYSIKTIWGLAKSPELSLDKDDLYALIERETSKDSMRELTQREIDRVCQVLLQMKDRTVRVPAPARRTDEGGNPATMKQRRKIYKLAEGLGWDVSRINGFAHSEFGVTCHEWLSPMQCSDMIEALKDMAERQSKKCAEQ